MIAITYRATLLQPLLATALQGDPNSSVSFDYIPGSLIRGALIGHVMRDRGLKEAQVATDEMCQRLFFSGAVRYLNAYPLDHEGRRTLPTPRSLQRRKRDELANEAHSDAHYISVYDVSQPAWNDEQRRRAEAGDTLKPIGRPFYALSATGVVRFYEPMRAISVHIQRDPNKGRSLRQSGQVFQYDALAAEQCFAGIALVDKESEAASVEALLNDLPHCWLGRSRSANYGKVAISHVSRYESEGDDPWREYEIEESLYDDLPAGEQHVHNLTLLSDVLLHDADGNALTRLDATLLARYLGLPAADLILDEPRTFVGIEWVGGFNRAWHMPLRQSYALAAGSVISFRLQSPLTAARVQELEQQGIGERRTEGYGRLAFNMGRPIQMRACSREVFQETFATSDELPTQGSDLARRMARRLFDQQLDRKIVDYVHSRLTRKEVYEQMPPNSQLARVRVLVRRALPKRDAALVLNEFNRFRSTAREHFNRAHFGEQSLSAWITQLLEQPEQVWSELGQVDMPSVAGHVASRDSTAAALRLISAVLTAPARLRGQESEEQP